MSQPERWTLSLERQVNDDFISGSTSNPTASVRPSDTGTHETSPSELPSTPPGEDAKGYPHHGRDGNSTPAETPPPQRTFLGTVRDAETGLPIANAEVSGPAWHTRVTATTDALGAYTLSGPGLLNEVAAASPGYITGVTGGWNGTTPVVVELHAQSQSAQSRTNDLLPIFGTVAYSDGTPAVETQVVGTDGNGGRIGPFSTDADGRFEGLAEVYGMMHPDGWSLLAYAAPEFGTAGLALVRRAAGVDGDIGTITLGSADGLIAVDRSAADGRGYGTIEAHMAGGPSLAIGAWNSELPGDLEAPFFELPGLTFSSRVHVSGEDSSITWDAPITAAGPIYADLPPFLGPTTPVAPAYGDRITWPAVAGASGYRVTMVPRFQTNLAWEADVALPAVSLGPWTSPQGANITIVAMVGDHALSTRFLTIPAEAHP